MKSKVAVPSVTGKGTMDFHKSKKCLLYWEEPVGKQLPEWQRQETVTPAEFELAASCFPERLVSGSVNLPAQSGSVPKCQMYRQNCQGEWSFPNYISSKNNFLKWQGAYLDLKYYNLLYLKGTCIKSCREWKHLLYLITGWHANMWGTVLTLPSPRQKNPKPSQTPKAQKM